MDRLLQDVRFALRSLARSPGFTVVGLFTLALGIGATTAMFSVVNGILLRPLPYSEPDALVRLHQANPEQGLLQTNVSAVDFEDWHAQSRSFDGLAAYWNWRHTLTGHGEAVELQSAWITEDFFSLLGSPMQLGRPLVEDDFRQAAPNAVISDRLWTTRFGADPGVIGSSVQLNGSPHTIVGVAGSRFNFPAPDTDVWVPHALVTPDMIPRLRQVRYLESVGRLRSGVSIQAAEADLSGVAARLATEHPQSNQGWDAVTVVPLRESIVGDVNQALVVLFGVVGFILLITCVNLANLLLARGSTRAREVAIRSALGARHGRLVQQFLTESVLLALAGGVLGLVLSYGFVSGIVALSAETLPRVGDVRLDASVLGFALLLSLLTGLLFGLLPAYRNAHGTSLPDLKEGRGTTGTSGLRLRNTLVVAEVTLAVVLVVGAGLMMRSFVNLRSVDPGFDPDRVLTVSMDITIPPGLPMTDLIDHLITRKEVLIERVAALPGVVGAATINTLPLRGEGEPIEFTRAGSGSGSAATAMRSDTRYISEDYFRTMGIPLIRGAEFTEEIAESGPQPVLVSETAARRFWPGADPLGEVVQTMVGDLVVTGIVGDVRQAGLAEEPPAAIYLSQKLGPRPATTLVVRTAGDPLALARPIRGIVHDIDPNQPVQSIATLTGVVDESLAQERFFTLLFSVFGALALGLAALGLYGVLAYSVGQRTQEIGVRIALGARGADVVRMVVRSGMLLVGAGILLGSVAALMLTRFLESRLYGVSVSDPLTFAAAVGVLTVVALAASYLPARKAMRVPPMVALRAD